MNDRIIRLIAVFTEKHESILIYEKVLRKGLMDAYWRGYLHLNKLRIKYE